MARTVPPLVANLSCHSLISLLASPVASGLSLCRWQAAAWGGEGGEGVGQAEWHVLCHKDTGVESGPGLLYTDLPGVSHKEQK